MNTEKMETLLQELKKPFRPDHISWKPGSVNKEQTRALAFPYADLRAYQERLDEVCGLDWSVTYTPWGERLVCHLTICGITRSSTGEPDSQAQRNEISGTSAEAQAFKRACSMFSLGRYLYLMPNVWVEYDPQIKQFTDQAKARLEGLVALHYQRAMQEEGADAAEGEGEALFATQTSTPGTLSTLRDQFDALGHELYGEQWEQICKRNVARITEGESENADDLTSEQLQKLINGMNQVKRERSTATKQPKPVQRAIATPKRAKKGSVPG